MLKISSSQNPRIKHIVSLAKAGNRKKDNLFIIEGFREISRAYENKIEISSLFICPDIISSAVKERVMHMEGITEIFEITSDVYSKIAYRENTDGLIALARPWNMSLEDLKIPENPLILILETVEKPGNLGAILRTADAAAVDAIIICDPQTDVFNPNVIRSSVGCIFSNQIAVSDSDSVITFLKKHGIQIFSAALQNSVPYTGVGYRGAVALAFGSEADGLSQQWRTNASQIIQIPMLGIADSLNVSVSVAVILFEAVRQRGIM